MKIDLNTLIHLLFAQVIKNIGESATVNEFRDKASAEIDKLERIKIRVFGIPIKVGVRKADRDKLKSILDVESWGAKFIEDVIVRVFRQIDSKF